MANDLPPDLPRKKRSILWYIAGVLLLLLGIFFFQLFGPNPPIVVSRQTTHITEPRGPNGLPSYQRYVLEQSRDGVTPQNNAAVLIWTALWPGELSPGDYATVAKELGLAGIPSKNESLAPLYGYMKTKSFTDWLSQRLPALGAQAASDDSSTANLTTDVPQLDDETARPHDWENAMDQVYDQAVSRPWTSEQIPPFADWVHQNQKPLDLLVEASRRPRCYFPSPSLLKGDNGSLIAMLLPGIQGSREAGRSLSARAMWHLGEGRTNDAWQDILAIHRIGRLVAQGPTMIDQLVGIALDGIACDRTQTLVHDGKLSVEQLQQIRRDLAALPPFQGMAPTIGESERLMALDAIMQLSVMNNASWNDVLGATGNDIGGLSVFQVVSVDWNLVLRDMNEWYDRLAAAARQPNRADRVAAMETVQADVQTLFAEAQRPTKIAIAAISRQQRSEIVAAMMLGVFLPAIDAATAAEDRANAQLQLTQLAAALAEFRAVHGAYPEKLDELVPGVLDKLPADVYTASPFIYTRDDDGYLLYSAGDNGRDDGGSNEMQSILAGRSVYDDRANYEQLQSKIPAGADDISIRLPRAPLQLPFPASRGVLAPDEKPDFDQ
jgi:hypothetical protein